jgi:hypothetical protein
MNWKKTFWLSSMLTEINRSVTAIFDYNCYKYREVLFSRCKSYICGRTVSVGSHHLRLENVEYYNSFQVM